MTKEPLYFDTKDFQNDMGVRQLSATATGVYFWLLCILHESETYGKFCLSKYASKTQAKGQAKQKQESELCYLFASNLSRLMPFPAEEIAASLEELLYYNIIQISGEAIEQKRMVRDGQLSEKRAQAGRKGGNARKRQDVPEDDAAGEGENLLKQNTEQNGKQNGSKQPSKTEANSGNLLASRAGAYTPPSITTNTDINEGKEDEKGVQGEKTAAQIEADKVALFVSLWHQHCPGLPKVQKLTQARRDKIRARLKDEPDLATWVEVFKKIAASSFCNGDNRQGWKASFDWITTNGTNYVKVLEGNYDRTANNTRPAGPSSAGSADPGVPADGYEDRL